MNNFPDRCLEYLNKIGISYMGPYDLSDSIFSGVVKCFSIQAVYNGKNIIGIGVDQDEYLAASKCLSEFLERLFVVMYELKTESNVCGTAFHHDLAIALRASEEELLERATLSVLGTVFSHRVHLQECSLVSLPGLKVLQQDFQSRYFRLEYFPDQPVFYVELRRGKFLSNGFALGLSDETQALSKAFLESYRRMKIFMANELSLVKSLTEFSQATTSFTEELGIIEKDQVETFFHHIDDLGIFTLRSMKNLPFALDLFTDPRPINTKPHKPKGVQNEQLQKTTYSNNNNGQKFVCDLLNTQVILSNQGTSFSTE